MNSGQIKKHVKILLSAAAVAAALPASAFAQDCKPHAVDLGEGKSIEAGCEPLSIAFLTMGTNNQYLQSGIKAAEDAAKEFGATIDVFDGGWTPATQFNQIQNILSSGKYNAILAEMADGKQTCSILSEEAPKQGVLVTVANNPLCGKDIQEGEELWTAGTLAYVGGSQGREAYRNWMMWVAEQNPGPQKIALITGPDLISNTVNTDLAVKDVEAKYPDFKVVAYIRTDYSVPQANQKTLPVLLANPDLTMIVSNYSDMTRGAVQAIRQAGKEGTIKVFESGGSAWAFEAIKAGQIESTRTFTPYTEMYLGVKSLADAWKGEPVSRYIELKSDLVTKENVDQIKPEY